jgi:hypothetical protein
VSTDRPIDPRPPAHTGKRNPNRFLFRAALLACNIFFTAIIMVLVRDLSWTAQCY